MRPIPIGFRLLMAGIVLLCNALASRSEQPAAADKKPAVLVVRLPAEAELYIDDFKSTASGEVREFDTPPLAVGKKFAYRIKAVWSDNGKEVVRRSKVVVQAGETTEINLLVPPKPESKKKPEAEKKPLPEKKLEPEKKPEAKKSEAEKKPEPVKKPLEKKSDLDKREVEKKPEAKKPEPEKKPEPKKLAFAKEPERLKKPKPKPPVSKPPMPTVTPVPPVPPLKASLRLVMPESLTLQPGETKLLPIKVVRTDFKGPVTMKFDALPSGITIKDTTIAADKEKAYVEVTVTKEAAIQEAKIKVMGAAAQVCQDCVLKIKVLK